MLMRAENISKKYGDKVVIRDINFELRGGDILAVFGENGTGKTTLLKIIAGILKPDSGKITVENEGEKEIRKIFIGHIPVLYNNLTVVENLLFWAKIYGCKTVSDKIKEYLEYFDIVDYSDVKMSALSAGTMKKVDITRSLIISPQIIIIDEPFSNIDEKGRRKISDLLNSFAENGCIIVFSSPNLVPIRRTKEIFLNYYQHKI